MFSIFLLFLLETSIIADKSCQWNDKLSGYTYDLSPLHQQLNYQVPDTDTSMGMFNMIYEFNFCSGAVRCQGREVAAFEALEVMGKITENCDVLGLKETQEFAYLNPSYPDLGISITYKQGDMCFDVKDDGALSKIIQDNEQMQMTPRSVTFEVTCGHDEETFKVIDSSKCNIRLGIQHSAGCRAGSAPGTGGSSLLFYLLIGAALYFGGGIAYNNKQKQLSGIEALPHAEFWKEFPHYVKDGINFTLIRIMGLVKGFKVMSPEGGYVVI